MSSPRQYLSVGESVSFSGTHHNSELSQTALRVTSILAVASLFFGAACVAFIPASLEQRLGSFLFFGLAPAVCFYAGGYILSLALGITGQLCEMLATCCFGCAAGLLSLAFTRLMSFLSERYSRFLAVVARLNPARVNELSQNAIFSVHHLFWRAHAAIYECACWMVRSIARFLIRIESILCSQRG
jgi:hypothetical protein